MYVCEFEHQFIIKKVHNPKAKIIVYKANKEFIRL